MTRLFDLDAELAAGAEESRRQGDPTQAPVRTDPVRLALEKSRLPSVPPKAVAILKRAMRLADGERADIARGARLALDAIDIAPDFALGYHGLAICLERLGRLSKALECYERAWRLDPATPELYLNLAMLAWKLDMLDGAEKFLRLFIQMAPDSLSGPINLGGVLRDKGEFESSIELLRAAIYANPESYELWNSLGTTLLEAGRYDEAQVFYTEALRLKPDFARGHHNLAFTYELTGEAEKAVDAFKTALRNPASPNDEILMRHGLSHALLAAGRLEEGWDAYDVRLDLRYPSATRFMIDAPRWDGADPSVLAGKCALLCGEQGLGDEVLFVQIARDMLEAVGPDGELRIAVEHRLVPMVARALPGARVIRHNTVRREGADWRWVEPVEGRALDVWAPMIQPVRCFRKRVPDDFPATPFLVPDPEQVARWREQLAGYGPGLKVGLLWRSLKMDVKRSKYFTAFEQWERVLKTPGVNFVNLQYGEVADDLKRAEDELGVRIVQPEGIDLRNDLDGVSALGRALDLVVGPTNAASNIAAASGGEVWFVHPHRNVWTHMGYGKSPWYPNTRSFFRGATTDWTPVMIDVARALDERAAVYKAA